MRLIYPPRTNRRQNNSNPNPQPSQDNRGSESLEKPTFTIEAESVDYEILEEPKKKNEE